MGTCLFDTDFIFRPLQGFKQILLFDPKSGRGFVSSFDKFESLPIKVRIDPLEHSFKRTVLLNKHSPSSQFDLLRGHGVPIR